MSFLERQLEDPVRFRRVKRAFYLGLVASVAAEIVLPLVLDGEHGHFAFESFPGWGSLYGFLSCVAIILVSKLIGKAGLVRREDYYEH